MAAHLLAYDRKALEMAIKKQELVEVNGPSLKLLNLADRKGLDVLA